MSKSILTYILLSAVFLFSLAPVAGAACLCEQAFPEGVRRAYHCELDCGSCGGRDDAPQCKACLKLELVFDGIQCCTTECDICPVGETDCFGQCVNVNNDPDNCGGCDMICGPEEFCHTGECVPFPG
jgi:hypothetical protein